MKFQNAILFSKIFVCNESKRSNGLRCPKGCIFEPSLPIKFLLVSTFFRNTFFDTMSLKQSKIRDYTCICKRKSKFPRFVLRLQKNSLFPTVLYFGYKFPQNGKIPTIWHHWYQQNLLCTYVTTVKRGTLWPSTLLSINQYSIL